MPPVGKRVDDRTDEPPSPYTVLFSRQARRNLHEDLPLEVAIAATETIQPAIAVNPYGVGKPLDEPFDGFHSARRGHTGSSTGSARPSESWRSTRFATAATPTARRHTPSRGPGDGRHGIRRRSSGAAPALRTGHMQWQRLPGDGQGVIRMVVPPAHSMT